MRPVLARRVVGVCAAMLLLLMALFFVARATSNATYSRLEVREAKANVVRLEQVLKSHQRDIESVASDWGTWDDTYRLLLGKNPGFADTNLEPSSLQTIRADMMAFVNEDGRVLQPRRIDLGGSGKPLPFPKSLRALLEARPDYVRLTRIGQFKTGVLDLPEGLLLFTTRAVTDNVGAKPPHGVILVGRFLDADEVKDISRQTNLNVALHLAKGVPSLSGDVRRAFDAKSPVGTVITPSSASTMTGTTIVRDVAGSPVGVLMFHFPRTIYRAGQDSLRRFGSTLTIFGIFALALVVVTLVRQDMEAQEREHADVARRVSEERYRLLIRNMADAVFGLTSDGVIAFANPQASVLTGLANETLFGMHYNVLMVESVAERVGQRMPSLHGQSELVEIEILTAFGRLVPVDLSMTVTDAEATGGIAVQWIARDITERKRHEAKLVYLAEHDYLTGLMNRRRFEEEFDHSLERSRRGKHYGAFFWLGLDAFKALNDRFGHSAGDEVLTTLANTLGTSLRAGSVMCRLEGDQFGILLYDVDAEGARVAAERLLSKVHAIEFLFSGQSVHVTGCLGISLFPGHGSTVEELMGRADTAMYAAKSVDRNCFDFWQPNEDWEDELSARFEWSAWIEEALANDRFLVYAQPIVDLSDGSVDRYELLIRLQGEDGEVIQPDSFLPVAERVGLINQIDRWMVRYAIALLAAHHADSGLHLDVNLSGKAMADPKLLALIESGLRDASVDPARLGFEITETAAIVDMNKARTFVGALKNIGCRAMLDDFGSGFSSFYYLNNLLVDGLKIDGSFVMRLKTSPRDQHIVRAIVELCGGFGITSTGEFVEDAGTYEALRRYGVTYAQGFAMGRPIPAEEAFVRGAAIPDGGECCTQPRERRRRAKSPKAEEPATTAGMAASLASALSVEQEASKLE